MTQYPKGRNESGNGRVLTALTVLHPLTDACTAALATAVAESAWQIVLYNFVAFALQLPMGWVLDACRLRLRRQLWTAAGLMGAGLLVYAVFGEPVVAISLACLGNAVFHVAAGKHLLDADGGRVTRTSLFISTGAIGLVVGMRFGASWPVALTLGSLAVYAAVCLAAGRRLGAAVAAVALRPLSEKLRFADVAVLLPLGALVVWRSYGVLTATALFSSRYRAIPLAVALVACSWLGQAVSGWLSDRLGRARVLVVSLIGSAALFWACPETCVWGWLALMFVAQLATGPVMGFLHSACRARSGLAFGVNCLALFASTLFLYCPPQLHFYLAGDWLAIALEFAATAWMCRRPHWFAAIALVNVVTHPALVYAVSRLGRTPPVVALGEGLVVLAEGAILAILYRSREPAWKMLLIALWMNAASYAAGVCLFGF